MPERRQILKNEMARRRSLLGDGLQQLQQQEAAQEAVGASQQRHLRLGRQRLR